MTQILDPTDERVPVRRTLAGRPGKITGTVALLDINKARGDVMIDQLKRRLNERLPDVQVVMTQPNADPGGLEIAGVLLTMWDPRSNLAREVADAAPTGWSAWCSA